MAIPDYQSFMLPLLKYCGDGKEHRTRDLVDAMAAEFNITAEEKKTLILSGTQPLYYNRIAWALTYLKKAGLLESPKRGFYTISALGKKVLNSKPDNLDRSFLMQFPEFVEFQKVKKTETDDASGDTQPTEDINGSKLSPDDLIERQYQLYRKALADELLTSIMEGSPSFFEKLVVELLLAMGYGGTRQEAFASVTGQSGDEGIDGVIQEDRLGLDVVYLQAKRWQKSSSVGRPEIQQFAGALQGKRAKKGVFITTASFSKQAIEYARNIDSRIVLIDGDMLTNLMIDYDIGVSRTATYELKSVDTDYFVE